MDIKEVIEMLVTVGYPVVIAALAFIFAELSKSLSIPTRYIPYINAGIGLVAAGISFLIGILPCGSALEVVAGIGACIISALGAGGFYDLLSSNKTPSRPKDEINEDTVDHEIPGEG
jgi:hypothetical protein